MQGRDWPMGAVAGQHTVGEQTKMSGLEIQARSERK